MRVGPKSKMMRMTQLNLYENDLAFFECQIRRYRPKDATDWTSWKTSLKLCSIIRLWEATANVPEEEESEDESLQRVDTDDEFEGY